MVTNRSHSVVTWKECCILVRLTLIARSVIGGPDALDTNSKHIFTPHY